MSTMIQAIRMALHVGESRLGVTDIFGDPDHADFVAHLKPFAFPDQTNPWRFGGKYRLRFVLLCFGQKSVHDPWLVQLPGRVERSDTHEHKSNGY